MKEDQIINKAIQLLDNSNEQAYDYLLLKSRELGVKSSQFYNFLYCLASLCNKKEDALSWLEEAVIDQGLWYRPSVFDDDDLKNIMSDPRFLKCKELSDHKYLTAIKSIQTVCTWEKQTKDKLVLAFHGNQQNMQISKQDWEFMSNEYQVETIQSKEIDSIDLYRWEDDEDSCLQLKPVVQEIDWDLYQETVLCGFSAGCNIILESIVNGIIKPDSIILVSPWIPYIDDNLQAIIESLIWNKIKVNIVCGTADIDCYPLAKTFVNALLNTELICHYEWIEGLDHEFPTRLNIKNIIHNKSK